MARIAAGVPAPQFTATDYLGEAFSLEELRGHKVLLVFNRGFF